MKNLFLTFAILLTMVATANSQVVRPLPQLVQNLSNENYAIWASWQNQQAARRAEEILTDTAWDKFSYAKRLISSSFGRGNTSTQVSSSSRSSSQSGKGWFERSGSSSGQATANFNRYGGTVITSRQVRYRNPSYVGAGTVITYNPWTRLRDGIGSPNWNNLFVPCKEGTLTLQEALNQIRGPQNSEKVFTILMEDYFD